MQNLVDPCGKFDTGQISPAANAPRLTLALDDSLFLKHLQHLHDEEWIAPGSLLQTVEECRWYLLDLQHMVDQFCDLGPAESLQFQFVHN